MDQFEMMLLQIEKHSDYYNSYPDGNSSLDFTSLHNNNNMNDDNNNNSVPYTEFPSAEYGTHQNPSGVAHSFIGQHASGFLGPEGSAGHKGNSMAAMREMIFRIAAMQPVHIDPDSVKPPKRRNVKISSDPQSVAARHRRERISERIRILQRLVPGGTKMDTASMLDEAIHYVKFLKNQVRSLERVAANRPVVSGEGMGFPVPMSSGNYFPLQAGEGFNNYHHQATSTQHLSDS